MHLYRPPRVLWGPLEGEVIQRLPIGNLSCVPLAVGVGPHISRWENGAQVVAGANQKVCQALCGTRGGVALPLVHPMTRITFDRLSF